MNNKKLEIKLNGKKITFKDYFEAFLKSSQKQVSKYWLPKEKEMKKEVKPRLSITRKKNKLYVWVKKNRL